MSLGLIPLGSPLGGRNSEWNKSTPVQGVCISQDMHHLGLPVTASFFQAGSCCKKSGKKRRR